MVISKETQVLQIFFKAQFKRGASKKKGVDGFAVGISVIN